MTYTLTDLDRAAFEKLGKQHAEALEVIERAKQVLDQKQREALAISGALQGAVLLLASQNGLGESVKFNDDFTKLVTVVD